MHTEDKQKLFQSIVARLDKTDFHFLITTMLNCGLEEKIINSFTPEDYEAWANSDADNELRAMDMGTAEEDWSNIDAEFNKFSAMERSELEAFVAAHSDEIYSEFDLSVMTRQELVNQVNHKE